MRVYEHHQEGLINQEDDDQGPSSRHEIIGQSEAIEAGFNEYLLQDEPKELSQSEMTERVQHELNVEEQALEEQVTEDDQQNQESAEEQQPLLFVDINLGGSE